MSSSVAKPALASVRPSAALTFVAAWLVPGAGHFLQGQLRKAVILFVVLTAMFAIGLGFAGRLFPFQVTEPLVFLAALAEWAIGVPRMIGAFTGAGRGDVVAATYEYGNTFLIAAGLLNVLAIFDAHDLATGRKPA
jgi:Family of unknown function (DUF6677)